MKRNGGNSEYRKPSIGGFHVYFTVFIQSIRSRNKKSYQKVLISLCYISTSLQFTRWSFSNASSFKLNYLILDHFNSDFIFKKQTQWLLTRWSHVILRFGFISHPMLAFIWCLPVHLWLLFKVHYGIWSIH